MFRCQNATAECPHEETSFIKTRDERRQQNISQVIDDHVYTKLRREGRLAVQQRNQLMSDESRAIINQKNWKWIMVNRSIIFF